MATADSGARQSGYSASTSEARYQSPSSQHQPPSSASYQPQRDSADSAPRDHPAMAAAGVLAPSSHQPQPSYSIGYSHPGSGADVDKMISSSEPRRQPEEHDAPSRQSLPSISEVISSTKREPYPHAPPPSMQPGSSLPSPFPPTSRPFPDAEPRRSPQPLPPVPAYPSRQEPLAAFTSSPRPPPFNSRPTLPPVSDRPNPIAKSDLSPRHHPSESQKPPESHAVNGSYAHSQQQQQLPPPLPAQYQPGQLPPNQMPYASYSVSPHHSVPPHAPGQYDPRGPPTHPEEADYNSRTRYDPATLNRHFESWSYQEALSRVASTSRTVYNFAEAYMKIASEQNHPPQPVPERLPTEREVGEMLSNIDLMKRSLEQVRETVQISIQNERAREGAKAKGTYDEDQDVPMYGDGMKPQYPMAEVKKRRGRAAPPGRCHSCNRIDTPEWRRGPDGARTLCNACGLHYAKLERKRQLEARSIRPKPEDRS